MNVALRPVGLADAPVLAVIHAAAFGPEAWDAAALAQLLSLPGTSGMLASDGDAPVGFALARTAADEAELLTIGVLPEARGHGLGRLLLETVLDAARTAGAAALFLEVAIDNTVACSLYTRAGFRQVGHRRGYYRRGTGSVDALVLRRDL